MVLRNGKPANGVTDFGVRPSPSSELVERFLTVDPGDVHVGVAEFTRFRGSGPWFCTWAAEFTPDTFLPWLVLGLQQRRWTHVVVESWRLFPKAAPIYIGSDMPTSRLIGAIAALVAFVPEDDAWFDEAVGLSLQDPQIKVPTRGYLKKRKLRSVAKILGVTLDHASDAELHGYKYLIDRNQPFNNATQQENYWRDVEQRELSPRHDLW